MVAKVLIRPPVRPSNGAQTIREQLGDKVARLSRINPIPTQYKYLINWGNSSAVNARHAIRLFNSPAAIATASNKLACFLALQKAGVRIPEFSQKQPERAGAIWLARTVLHGSCGDGIVVVRKDDAFPAAPLYVKYIPKREEYRVHVAFGQAIFIQQKKRKSDNEQTADQKLIRNYDNGWVFCPVDQPREEWSVATKQMLTEALSAVRSTGLDFGAVDLIIGRDDGLPYILEINTAPGLESPGLIEAYTKAFQAVTI